MNADERNSEQQGYGQPNAQQQSPGQAQTQAPAETGQAAYGNSGQASEQERADEGQDAPADDTPPPQGTTDIEVERSQGRETDIEGNSL